MENLNQKRRRMTKKFSLNFHMNRLDLNQIYEERNKEARLAALERE